MLDHHGFSELEDVGFIQFLEQLEEAIRNSRQIQEPMATGLEEGYGRGPFPRARIMGYGIVINLNAL